MNASLLMNEPQWFPVLIELHPVVKRIVNESENYLTF